MIVEKESRTENWQILAPGNIPSLEIKEVWRYRDLLWRFVKKDLIVNYRQTILGPLWVILEPLMAALIYLGIFTKIVQIPVNGIPPLLFFLSGVIVWIYFNDTVSNLSATFLNNAALLNKVYFPRLILPLSYILSRLTRLLIQLILLFCLYIYYKFKGSAIHLSPNAWYLPLLILHLALLTMAVGLLLSALSARYRDLQYLLMFFLRLMMFATPVFYPLSVAHGTLKTILSLNPLSAIVEGFRAALFGTSFVDLSLWLYSAIITIIMVLLGLFSFAKVEQNVVDTI